MPVRSALSITLSTLAFLLLFSGKLSAVRATQKNKKQPLVSQDTKCLEQNVEASGDDVAFPCVGGGPSTSGPSVPPQPPVAPPIGVSGENKLVRELPAYESGYFLHPKALKFCELL